MATVAKLPPPERKRGRESKREQRAFAIYTRLVQPGLTEQQLQDRADLATEAADAFGRAWERMHG